MGHVALAMFGDPGAEQLCVVKRMLPHLLVKEGHVQRFEDEANLCRRLSHGCIVQTLATGRAEGEPFIAQALVDGRDLAEVVARVATQETAVPLGLWVHLVREVCRGLSYAHDFEDLGLVHRDISPQNIRLTFTGEVKLMDFGLAFSREKKAMTTPGALLGRAAYMPPEQLAGEPVDRRADLYAVGVVLWELVSGQLFGTVLQDEKPVYASDPRAALARAFKPNPIPPSTFNPDVPPGLDAVVLKAVSPAKDQRFSSATELRAALTPFVPVELDGEARWGELLRSLFRRDGELERRQDLVAQGRALLSGAAPANFSVGETVVTEPVRRSRTPAAAVSVVIATAAVVVGLGAVIARRGHEARVEGPANGPSAAMQLPAAPPSPLPATSVAPPRPREPSPPQPPPTQTTPPPELPSAPPAGAQARPRRPPASARPAPAAPTPANPAGPLVRAREAFVDGNLDAALREAQAALESGAGAEALVVIGNVHFSRKRFRDAERAYAEALRLAPSNQKVAERLQVAREMSQRQ
jgi:hypothetical protein